MALPVIAEIGCNILTVALNAVLTVFSLFAPRPGKIVAGIITTLLESAQLFAVIYEEAGGGMDEFTDWLSNGCGTSHLPPEMAKVFNKLNSAQEYLAFVQPDKIPDRIRQLGLKIRKEKGIKPKPKPADPPAPSAPSAPPAPPKDSPKPPDASKGPPETTNGPSKTTSSDDKACTARPKQQRRQGTYTSFI